MMIVAKRMEPKIRIPIHRGKQVVLLKLERKKIIMRMYPPTRKIGHSKLRVAQPLPKKKEEQRREPLLTSLKK